MKDDRESRTDQPHEQKQGYAQPKLVKHGKVENLTLASPPIGSTSRPIYTVE